MKKFQIAAMRRGVLTGGSGLVLSDEKVASAAAIEFANLGFQTSPLGLQKISPKDLSQSLEAARELVGADRNTRPVYPGFPSQVQNLDTLTLIFEQLLHYWTRGEFLPNYSDVARPGLPLEDMCRAEKPLKVLPTNSAAEDFIQELTLSPVALSEADKELLRESIRLTNIPLEIARDLLSKASNGEVMHHFIDFYMDANSSVVTRESAVESFLGAASNLDQALRVVLATSTYPVEGREDNYLRAVENLSKNDAHAVKFHSLPRSSRRVIVSRLGELSSGFYADSLVSRKRLWQRVLRMAHPYDLTLRDKSKRAVDIVHDNVDYKTLNSEVEMGLENGDVKKVVTLLAENNSGNLLRRIAAILRRSSELSDVVHLSHAVGKTGDKSSVSTLISAYNGVVSINDRSHKITRVAGRNNTLRKVDHTPVDELYIDLAKNSILRALRKKLSQSEAPESPVGVISRVPVPLVARDAANSAKTLDRGSLVSMSGGGDTVRLFSHWVNNQSSAGYMDIGAVVLDKNFNILRTCTWNSWNGSREWATYSGDTNVAPGKDAAEYIDVDLVKLRENIPDVSWVAMTVISWSGFPMADVDIIAGAMLRSEQNSGEVFDPRTIASAFTPTTKSFHSLPLAVNVSTGEMFWVDSSNGSTQISMSAEGDETIGALLYDEIARPRMTLGELAEIWAEAHGVETSENEVDRDQVVKLLK